MFAGSSKEVGGALVSVGVGVGVGAAVGSSKAHFLWPRGPPQSTTNGHLKKCPFVVPKWMPKWTYLPRRGLLQAQRKRKWALLWSHGAAPKAQQMDTSKSVHLLCQSGRQNGPIYREAVL